MIETIKPTPKTTKWIVTLFGIIISSFAIGQLFRAEVPTNWGLTQAIILIEAGPLMIVYGIILFIEDKN